MPALTDPSRLERFDDKNKSTNRLRDIQCWSKWVLWPNDRWPLSQPTFSILQFCTCHSLSDQDTTSTSTTTTKTNNQINNLSTQLFRRSRNSTLTLRCSDSIRSVFFFIFNFFFSSSPHFSAWLKRNPDSHEAVLGVRSMPIVRFRCKVPQTGGELRGQREERPWRMQSRNSPKTPRCEGSVIRLSRRVARANGWHYDDYYYYY